MFGCKFRAALATTSRRPLRNAVIPATDGNAEYILNKSSCLLYVRSKFSRQHRVNYEFFLHVLLQASTPSTLTSIPMAFLPSIKKLYCNQCFGGLAPSLGPHAIYNISSHLRLKGVSPVNELGPGRLLNFPLETSTASFSRCSGILLAGSEIDKSKGIELSMGSTVTIKDMTTLEEFILINTLHQCQSV